MWSSLLQCTWWLVTQNKKAMVEYDVNFQGWLDEATLFPAEPDDYGFNFDEILSSGKANNEEVLDTCLPDLDWLDASADLNILDDPTKGFNFQPLENTDLNDAASFLLGMLDGNLDTSCLSSNVSKDELTDILNASAQIEQQVSSPGVSDLALSSPYYESISEASSPASVVYSSTEWLNPDLCLSPSGASSVDDGGYESISEVASPATIDSGVVSVTVCDMDTASDPLATVSIDEVTHSVRKRRYVSDGNDIPKVKVSLKNVFHPYAKATTKRSGGKNERKKVQNKEAAARYRVKKRIEEKELSGEVEGLEKEQEELRKKHDGLLTEIKYLKSLMREVLQKKGVL